MLHTGRYSVDLVQFRPSSRAAAEQQLECMCCCSTAALAAAAAPDTSRDAVAAAASAAATECELRFKQAAAGSDSTGTDDAAATVGADAAAAADASSGGGASSRSSSGAASSSGGSSEPSSEASTSAVGSNLPTNVALGVTSSTGRKVMSFTFHCWHGDAAPSIRACHEVPKATAKVGCEFRLKVEFWQLPDRLELRAIEAVGHTGHVLGSPEDAVFLRPDQEVTDEAKRLLQLGLTPYQVWHTMHSWANAEHSGSSNDFLASFSHRTRLSRQDIKKLANQLAREQCILENDVGAVQQLVSSLAELGDSNPVLLYQPQQLDADGEISQDLVLVMADPFGLAMLDAFGTEDDSLVLLDATGGTLYYGYQLHVLAVVDEFREGVPVAFMMTSGQDADVVQQFIKVCVRVCRGG